MSFQQKLNEALLQLTLPKHLVGSDDVKIDVFTNPTRLQTIGLFNRYGELRYLVDQRDKVVVVWDASTATHQQVVEALNATYETNYNYHVDNRSFYTVEDIETEFGNES